MRQIVVLGAGLDTTGLRHSDGDGSFRVFEVDEPEMQLWKRQHLSHVDIDLPSSLVFVPVDFERQAWSEELQRSVLKLTEPAFFVWLGVVPYLTIGSITATLRFAASLPEAEIVFDYSEPTEDLPPAAKTSFEQRRAQVVQVEDSWISHLKPASRVSSTASGHSFKTISAGRLRLDPCRPAREHTWFTRRSDIVLRSGADLPFARPTALPKTNDEARDGLRPAA